MNVDKTTCWYSTESDKEMVKGANGELWPKLEASVHWPVLEKLLQLVVFQEVEQKIKGRIDFAKLQLLDVGCGAGELGATKIVNDNFVYYGMDLPHIVENVAWICNPNKTYLQTDVLEKPSYKDFKLFGDIVVMNAFVDVMERPIEVLEKLIPYCINYIIIHRQFTTTEKTYVETKYSYGGKTYISHINIKDWDECFKDFESIVKIETGLANNNYSFLYRRKK